MNYQHSFDFGRPQRKGPTKPRPKKFMGIPSAEVRRFMSRATDDYRVAKRLSDEQIESMHAKLPVAPPIWAKLRRDQKICFLIGAMTKRFYFANDMGTGKSLLAIALCLYFAKLNKVQGTLILVPNRTNKYDWVVQFKKHAPYVNCLVLEGSTKDKWQQMYDDDSPFVVETYGGFIRFASEMVEVKNKKKNKLVVHKPRMLQLMNTFDAVIFDEITQAKTKDSLTFRMGRFLSKNAYCVFGLSGTPFGRSPEDLWAQLYLIDQGDTLGGTLTLFRAAFFNVKNNYAGYPEYHFAKRLKGKLNRMLANRMIRYLADEADLPKVIPIRKTILLPDEADGYFQQQLDKLRQSKGNVQELQSAFMRLRQISSGFMGYTDDETKNIFAFPENPKLEALIDLIKSTDAKMVVFHDFIYSGDRITAELNKLKIKSVRIYGKTKDPDGELRRFNEQPEYRIALVNNAAGGFGLDRLKVANYAVYYESPVPTIIRRQTERRIRRQGSEHGSVFIYDLVVAGTVDEMILTWHAGAKDLFQAIVEGKVKL